MTVCVCLCFGVPALKEIFEEHVFVYRGWQFASLDPFQGDSRAF